MCGVYIHKTFFTLFSFFSFCEWRKKKEEDINRFRHIFLHSLRLFGCSCFPYLFYLFTLLFFFFVLAIHKNKFILLVFISIFVRSNTDLVKKTDEEELKNEKTNKKTEENLTEKIEAINEEERREKIGCLRK